MKTFRWRWLRTLMTAPTRTKYASTTPATALKSSAHPATTSTAFHWAHQAANKMRLCKSLTAAAGMLLALSMGLAWGGPDRASEFLNKNSVLNTRHNMSQRNGVIDLLAGGPNSGGAGMMDSSRNDYGEVCVYCHTPHGANTTTAAPLWNRTMLTSTVYTTYTSMTIEGVVGSPGANSLTCLSCHDGTTAVDSIINMPGSGRYLKAQETSQNNGFLNDWPSAAAVHDGLNSTGCLACHNPTAPAFANTATDFTAFALGTDLSNDHPIGVPYRGLTPGTDYNGGTTTSGNLLFFDRDGDSRADKNEVRFYNTGGGFEVECASCHDPHGVPSGGAGSTFIGTFLRIANSASALCLTCHSK